jgi:CRISPR type IV-associated protein Csf3
MTGVLTGVPPATGWYPDLLARGLVDTTTDGRWTPLRVVAHLAEPIAGWDAHHGHLDGPLSWGAFLAWQAAHGRHSLPAAGPDQVVDFDLPLAAWTRPAPGTVHPLAVNGDGDVWGWACSAAAYNPAALTRVEVRRKPATGAMARYAPDRKHHISTGPLKARDGVVPAVLAPRVEWWALGDPSAVRDLLGRVTHLGRHTRHGHGRVLRWDVAEDAAAREKWRRRVFPDPAGSPDTVRAPYHHQSRRMPCSSTAHG